MRAGAPFRIVLALMLLLALPATASALRIEDQLRAEREKLQLAMLESLPDPAVVELGRLLFFDKLLSGNKNISCATCHHTLTGTTDWLSLPVGEGGQGLGPTRNCGPQGMGIVERVPRNAPGVFNLGLTGEFPVMFWDGRVAVDPSQPSGYKTPAGESLPLGMTSALAVQAMFPVTSAAEMAGQPGSNPIADAGAAQDFPTVWGILAERLRQVPEYVELFQAAFPDVTSAEEIDYVHAAEAIAAFEGSLGASLGSPFDRYLLGDDHALSDEARLGMLLFYSRAKCASCHTGVLQTDNDFHCVAVPQFGPGKADGPSRQDDFGLERVTKDPADRYFFRTPSLRNVALTGPWGHDGAYDSLRAMIRQHMDPAAGLDGYKASQAILPAFAAPAGYDDFALTRDAGLNAQRLAACDLPTIQLSNLQLGYLEAFLQSLTDPASLQIRTLTPETVPSGLPVAD